MLTYDYIIAGAGASGLSLVARLIKDLPHRKVLIIDRERKQTNDRTWCFWETGHNFFEEVVFRKWSKINFFSEEYSNKLDIYPYHYKMIRGIDFYNHVFSLIDQSPQVDWLETHVDQVKETAEGVSVTTGKGTFNASLAFNSLRPKDEEEKSVHYNYLLQHFKGWVIKTPEASFDPGSPTFMDFRVPQNGDCRFMYVLPFNEHEALIEYTLFSPDLLSQEEYTNAIKSYISDFLHISNYQVVHEEFGVIPMTDMPYDPGQGEKIINIGTAGGQTKPSSGYTFTRVQRHSHNIVRALAHNRHPLHYHRSSGRFMLYDKTLLNVIAHNMYPGAGVFARLFEKNKPQRVLRFLDEDTSIIEDLGIMSSVPIIPFSKGMLRSVAS